MAPLTSWKDGNISRVGEVVSHWAHNPKTGSANLSPATKEIIETIETRS